MLDMTSNEPVLSNTKDKEAVSKRTWIENIQIMGKLCRNHLEVSENGDVLLGIEDMSIFKKALNMILKATGYEAMIGIMKNSQAMSELKGIEVVSLGIIRKTVQNAYKRSYMTVIRLDWWYRQTKENIWKRYNNKLI